MKQDHNTPTTRRLTAFSQVEALYRQRLKKDFARNELRQLSSLRRSWKENAYDCYGLFDGDELLGYAFFVRLGNSYLVDYLGIAEEHRDEGLGSIFLRQLADHLAAADCVVVEVEDPDKAADAADREQRERRLQFYLRSGCRKTELSSCVFGADYRILEVPTGKPHTVEQLREVYTRLYQSILPGIFFHTQFHVS